MQFVQMVMKLQYDWCGNCVLVGGTAVFRESQPRGADSVSVCAMVENFITHGRCCGWWLGIQGARWVFMGGVRWRIITRVFNPCGNVLQSSA